MLLETFEDQFYIPSVTLKFCYYKGRKRKVVRQKHKLSILPEQNQLDEYRQLQQDFLLQFHKTVVWYCSWEEMPAMLADIMQIVMPETAEPSWVKMYEDYDYLCITHTVGLATVSFTVLRSFEYGFFLLRIKKLAEFVCQTENFSNFTLGEHSGKGLYIIFLATQFYNFYRYFSNFQRVNFDEN